VKRDNSLSASEITLRADMKRLRAPSGSSVGAISITDMVTNEGYSLCRYQARSLMYELNFHSYHIPKHNCKKANKEHIASQIYLNDNSLFLSLILITVMM